MPRFPLRDAPFILAARMFAEPIRRTEFTLLSLSTKSDAKTTYDIRSFNGHTVQSLFIQPKMSNYFLALILERSECAFFEIVTDNQKQTYNRILKGHPFDLLHQRESWINLQDLFEELRLFWDFWIEFLIHNSENHSAEGDDRLFVLSGYQENRKNFRNLPGSILRGEIDWHTGTIAVAAPPQNKSRRRIAEAAKPPWTVFVSYVGDPDRPAERTRREMQDNLTKWLTKQMRRFPEKPSPRDQMFAAAQEDFPAMKRSVFLRAWAAALKLRLEEDPATRWGRSGRPQGFRMKPDTDDHAL